MNGQASHCRCWLLRIADDRSRWATLTADTSIEESKRRPGVMGVISIAISCYQLLLISRHSAVALTTAGSILTFNKKPTIRQDQAKRALLNSKTLCISGRALQRFAHPHCHDNQNNGRFGKPTHGFLTTIGNYVLLNFEAASISSYRENQNQQFCVMRRRRYTHLSPIFGVKEHKCLIGCIRANEALESQYSKL